VPFLRTLEKVQGCCHVLDHPGVWGQGVGRSVQTQGGKPPHPPDHHSPRCALMETRPTHFPLRSPRGVLPRPHNPVREMRFLGPDTAAPTEAGPEAGPDAGVSKEETQEVVALLLPMGAQPCLGLKRAALVWVAPRTGARLRSGPKTAGLHGVEPETGGRLCVGQKAAVLSRLAPMAGPQACLGWTQKTAPSTHVHRRKGGQAWEGPEGVAPGLMERTLAMFLPRVRGLQKGGRGVSGWDWHRGQGSVLLLS
jgi:hypothetical protein